MTKPIASKQSTALGKLGAISVAIFFLHYGAMTIDHIVMVNAPYYPTMLAESVIVPSNGDAGIEGLTKLCKSEGGWTLYEKRNGYFMRCKTMLNGAWTWPKTYIIENVAQLSAEWRE